TGFKWQQTEDNEDYVDMRDMRRVTVRSFKKKVLIDIRDYYTDKAGEVKPTRKGISLRPSDWQFLVDNAEEISRKVKEWEASEK
ncbi:hypothetical protein KIPB_016115, partial [Kipferlia bialata]